MYVLAIKLFVSIYLLSREAGIYRWRAVWAIAQGSNVSSITDNEHGVAAVPGSTRRHLLLLSVQTTVLTTDGGLICPLSCKTITDSKKKRKKQLCLPKQPEKAEEHILHMYVHNGVFLFITI